MVLHALRTHLLYPPRLAPHHHTRVVTHALHKVKKKRRHKPSLLTGPGNNTNDAASHTEVHTDTPGFGPLGIRLRNHTRRLQPRQRPNELQYTTRTQGTVGAIGDITGFTFSACDALFTTTALRDVQGLPTTILLMNSMQMSSVRCHSLSGYVDITQRSPGRQPDG